MDPNTNCPAKQGRADITLPPISEIFDVAYRGRDPRTLSAGLSGPAGRGAHGFQSGPQPHTFSPAHLSAPVFTSSRSDSTGCVRRLRSPPDPQAQGAYGPMSDQIHSSRTLSPTSASYYSSYRELGQRNDSEYQYHTHESIADSSSSSHHHARLSEFRGLNESVGTDRGSGIARATRRPEKDCASLGNSHGSTTAAGIGSDVHMRSRTISPTIPSSNPSYALNTGSGTFYNSSRSCRQDSGSAGPTSSLPTSAVLQSQRFEGLARSHSSVSGSISSVPNSTSLMASSTHPSSRSHSRQEYELEQGYDPNTAPTSSATYQCTYCGKVFLRPSALKTHTISHTGEKDYECTEDGCGRRFGVRSNMLRHVRLIHHGTGTGVSRGPSSRGSGNDSSRSSGSREAEDSGDGNM